VFRERSKNSAKMALPFYLMVGGCALVTMMGLVVAYVWGWRNGQNLAVQVATTERSNSAPMTKQQTSMIMQQSDAFAIKERKKLMLLERSRKKYLELHPNFSPPVKTKFQ